jgi:hypothetical protein
MSQSFPSLDPLAIRATLNAVHAYTQVIGDWLGSGLPRRKHWWQLTVHPSIGGISTGLVQMGINFELELELGRDRLLGQVAGGGSFSERMAGRPASELAEIVRGFLIYHGIEPDRIPVDKKRESHAMETPAYSAEIAETLGETLRSVNAALATFRAGIHEETSPIQIWPHHFDLAMLWLPGKKIPGQDQENEEYSDTQMNFGFTFGDKGIPEPYFYITAYPLPDVFTGLALPHGTTWHDDGFSGAVLLYRTLLETASPADYLVNLWNFLLFAGRKHI